jgi:hypothetical protein
MRSPRPVAASGRRFETPQRQGAKVMAQARSAGIEQIELLPTKPLTLGEVAALNQAD